MINKFYGCDFLKYKAILFDLDGTLTDSSLGITNSVMYALKKKGYAVHKREDLYCFIGPPLAQSFCDYCNIQTEAANEMVEIYREYFSEKGIFENKLIENVEELLKFLKMKKVIIALATSKPQFFSKQILEHFKIDKYFDIVVGSNLDGSLTDKAEIISEVLKQIPEIPKEKIAMVGDRSYDIIGAQKNEITPIGVLCGFGDEKELSDSGAKYIFNNLKELQEHFKNVLD